MTEKPTEIVVEGERLQAYQEVFFNAMGEAWVAGLSIVGMTLEDDVFKVTMIPRYQWEDQTAPVQESSTAAVPLK